MTSVAVRHTSGGTDRAVLQELRMIVRVLMEIRVELEKQTALLTQPPPAEAE